ncbi:MAG TPA: histidine kinase [Caldimonas sp.]
MNRALRDAWHYARHAAMVAGFSAVIALGLGIAKGGDWDLQFAYSESIGLSIWACTDFGRLLFKRDPDSDWPAGWRAFALQVGAVIVGYVLGTWIGDQYCGCSTFELWRRSARAFAGYLVLCIAVSASISFFFLARGRDQRRLRQIATAQRDASEAQLKLLESQLEPHMLFNTLANLRVLIGIDPPRAQAMLDQLIAFLRATLSASREPFHALAAEFARLSDYLQLMQMRMGERLQTRLTLPAALADLPVPPLLLQPLVENAIKYGLEPHVGGGRIEVSAERVDGRILLRVRDTGAGLSGRAAAEGTRFGVAQVRQRLATIYGDAATLELTPAPDAEGGTVATVTIPA